MAKITIKSDDGVEVSDGFHTFSELYDHRIALWITLCRQLSLPGDYQSNHLVWRSRLHSDGSSFLGWFLLGFGVLPGTQITYHLPDIAWKDCEFANTFPAAPVFDGHTSSDVIARIKTLGMA